MERRKTHGAKTRPRSPRLRLVGPSDSGTQHETIDHMIYRFLHVKEHIPLLLAAERSLIETFERGFNALEVSSFQVNLDDGTFELSRVTSLSRSCDWEKLEKLYPAIYDELVEEKKSVSVEVRLVKGPSLNAGSKPPRRPYRQR